MGVFLRALKYGLAGGTAAGAGMFAYGEMAGASGGAAQAPSLMWPHTRCLDTFDYSAVRRGFQVYKQVCSACHSMEFLNFRHLINITHTVEEVKEMAAEYEIQNDDPNEEGDMFMRKRNEQDLFPAPYENEIQARLGNNGALPPDLSLIRNARTHEMDFHYGEDYIFHLLTGYQDPPAGVEVAEGMNYNPYFKGGAIGMGAPLYNDIIQYEDGTPATTSQLAADVCQFLTWSSMKHNDELRNMMFKVGVFTPWLLAMIILIKRHDWAGVKTMKHYWRMPKKNADQAYRGKPGY